MAEWQTRQSQKLLRGNPRVGSSPTFGTISIVRYELPPLFPYYYYNFTYLLDDTKISLLQSRVTHDNGLNVALTEYIYNISLDFSPRDSLYRHPLQGTV